MGTERGAATVELALLAMFLLLIVSGIVDLGQGMYTAIALDDAVHEGAIYAAFIEDAGGTPITADDIKNRVVASTSAPVLDVANVVVTCESQARAKQSGSRITVEATHTVDLITPFISDWFGGTLTLHRTSVADRFFADCPDGSTP